MRETAKQYDMQKKNKANLRASLRGVVSLYLLYLAWNIVKGAGAGSMPVWAGYLIGGIFVAAAAVFAVYLWRRYQQDMKAAEIDDATTHTDPT